MLVSYRVYEPEISQFVEEIKPFKMIEYNIKNKAYKLVFEDDTYVYVPKEHRLDKSIFVKNILDNCEKKDKQEFNEYYSLACNCIALRKMDDITEAQLSFNYMYSAEHFDDYGCRSPDRCCQKVCQTASDRSCRTCVRQWQKCRCQIDHSVTQMYISSVHPYRNVEDISCH